MALTFDPDGIPGFPENTGGIRIKLSASDLSPIDNIFVIQEGANKFRIQPFVKGVYHPSWILGTSGDKITYLQAIINHADVSLMIIDKAFTITGTLTIPTGKIIEFQQGGRIIGGTISGGMISAHSESYILDITTTLSEVKTMGGVFHCKWYGALGNNAGDEIAVLQKGVDYVVKNSVGVKTFQFTAGIFRISKGLLVFRDLNGDGDPDQVNIAIKGVNTAITELEGIETTLSLTTGNSFTLAIQKGKGCHVENLNLLGTNQLNYSYLQAFSTGGYVQGAQRTNSQSPHAGLVLDPFGSATTGADRYPGFESYYAGIVGNGGSTDCTFKNINVDGFIVGVILTPNTNTQNNEAHTFDGVWFNNCKDGFVTTNSQERTIACRNFKFWNSVQTCFRTNSYGLGRGDVPYTDKVNVAGTVYQLFNFTGIGGYFPLINIDNFYAENFYWIGIVTGYAVQFNNCHLAIADITQLVPGVKAPNFVAVGTEMTFMNCNLLTYNGTFKVPYNIHGRTKFTNCYLSNYFASYNDNWTYDDYRIEYEDCKFYCFPGFISNGSFESKGLAYSNLTYGAQTEIATYNKEYTSYKPGTYNLNSANYFAQYRRVKSPTMRHIPAGENVVVTVTGSTATATGLEYIEDGCIMYAHNLTLSNGLFNAAGYAVMRYAGYVGGQYTFDRVIQGMVSGTYIMSVLSVNYIGKVGFVDKTGLVASNAVVEGQITAWNMGTGYYIMSNMHCYLSASTPGGGSFAAHFNLGTNAEQIPVCNYEYEEFGVSMMNPLDNVFVDNGVAFSRGAIYLNKKGAGSNLVPTDVIGWICTRSGVKGSTVPPAFQDMTFGGGGMANPMTSVGDLIVGGAAGAPARKALGAALQVLRVNGAGTNLEYYTPGSSVPYILQALPDAVTINWNLVNGNYGQTSTLSGNRTLSITGMSSGVVSVGTWKFTQGVGGNFIPVLPGNDDDVVYRLGEGEINELHFTYDGTNFHWSSSFSSVVVYGNQLAEPGSFMVSGTIASTSAVLDWDAVVNATSYRLDRSTDPLFLSGVITGIYNGPLTVFTDTGLIPSTQYYWRVRAQATGFDTSIFSYTEGLTAPYIPQYATWFYLGTNYAQFNSNKGLSANNTGYTDLSWSIEQISEGDSVVFKIDSTVGNVKMGLHATRTPNPGNGSAPPWTHQVYAYGTGIIFYNAADTPSGLTWANNSLFRLRYTGGNVIQEVSNNAGASWSTITTNAATGSYYIGIYLQMDGVTKAVSEVELFL